MVRRSAACACRVSLSTSTSTTTFESRRSSTRTTRRVQKQATPSTVQSTRRDTEIGRIRSLIINALMYSDADSMYYVALSADAPPSLLSAVTAGWLLH